MHAYLIVGSQQAAQNHLPDLVKKLDAKALEFQIQKIEDVRQLRSFLALSQPEMLAIIIKDLHLASEDAQNALLKSLEEPQDNVRFILSAPSEEAVLETIISRVETISLFDKQPDIQDSLVADFFVQDAGSQLKIVSQLKTRAEATQFLDQLIRHSHTLLLKNEISANLVEQATKAYNALLANGNITLQLTNFIVHIQQNV